MIGLIELFGAVLLRPLRESREKTSAATTTVFEHAPVTTRLSGRRIWIDLDNSPHVPFFRPIISELKGRGCTLIITARDAYQVRELLEYYKVDARVIGKHYGKHKTLKAMGTIWRALALIHLIRQLRPEISLCHGSRACLITSKVLNIPNITIADYEHTAGVPSMLPTWLIVPSIVPDMHEGSECKVLRYPGIKEDVYLPEFRPDATLKKRLGISQNSLLITIRPPATEAHYHNPEAEILLKAALDRFVADPETQIILLPRNERQAAELRKEWRDAIAKLKIVIPEHAEDGMNLIWNSDLVISGGGTMNREAAALGVPVYSIFRGKIGAVDRYLAKQGRLVLIERVEDVATRIKPVRRSKTVQQVSKNNPALETIVRHVVSIFEGGTNPPQVGN